MNLGTFVARKQRPFYVRVYTTILYFYPISVILLSIKRWRKAKYRFCIVLYPSISLLPYFHYIISYRQTLAAMSPLNLL